ncbi:hypothetical protein [Nonomuraea typhae]|uniref:hypothetical protein n=1 Tax=Nonomuraea typhae TaxID=2603600 RepID=UPI0012F9BEE8|nr:hypothetical protein [Nonomuraea typhae]
MSLLTATKNYGGGAGVVYIPNAATPPATNPAGGGLLYPKGGLLKWRDPAGGIAAFGDVALMASTRYENHEEVLTGSGFVITGLNGTVTLWNTVQCVLRVPTDQEQIN